MKAFFFLARALVALMLCVRFAQAEFIQPVAAYASNGQATQDALINGQGFDDPGIGSPASIHAQIGGEMWSGIGSIKEYVIFDLGKTVALTNVYIWNYNVQDATDVGMKDVEVQVSADANVTNANFNAIARITLKEGGESAQSFPVIGTNVRLVKLKGLSNWGQGYTVGLAEVRFASGTVTGNVPVILLNAPHDGDEIALGADIAINATVTDRDGTANIEKVEFFDGGILISNRTVSPFTATLKGAAKGSHELRVVATDKTGKVAWVTANVFVRELVADRILKIDDTADEGTGLNQIVYTGTWNLAQGGPSDPRYLNNDHYESNNNKNDYFEVRFKGVKIDLFATVASHHGTALASIDGGPTSVVNYKAAQRAEQVFVWGSPILPNKEHVLRVRVAGDGVVTADRFDVSVSDKPEVTTATVTEVAATFTNILVKMQDVVGSVVDPTSIKLALDGALLANVNVSRTPPLTTITHLLTTPFKPGSVHVLSVSARDTVGAVLTNETSFTLPAPYFPATGLGIAPSRAGAWSVRQVWNGGRADALVSAVDLALASSRTGFAGAILNTNSPVINFIKSSNPGSGGIILGDDPFPAEVAGLSESDFVTVARARVKVPRSGDWTIGVHSDDGFGLRFIGAPFASVSGVGERDENFPEFMVAKNNVADSSTRGVLTNLAAGTYEIEFITWQRIAAAFCEIYAVEGAFTEDADTDQWQLIGSAGGWEVLSGVSLNVTAVQRAGSQLTIDFVSPTPEANHQLFESSDLKTWQPATGATLQKNSAGGRYTLSISGAKRFFRVVL